MKYLKLDIEEVSRLPPVDVVANVGGLYHVGNPKDILLASVRFARKFLIVQSVVSMANNRDDYFEVPAPG